MTSSNSAKVWSKLHVVLSKPIHGYAFGLYYHQKEVAMLFAYLARILSILLLVFGAFLVLTALAIAFDWLGAPRDLAMLRYLSAFKTTGEAIDRGCLYIVLAIALGTLSEIALCLRNWRD